MCVKTGMKIKKISSSWVENEKSFVILHQGGNVTKID